VENKGVVCLLLAIDVGNTNIMLGVYDGNNLQMCWRISTDRARTEDEYGVIIRNLFQQNGFQAECIQAMIISSVVPPLRYPLGRMAQKYFKVSPLIVGPGIKTGLNILMDNPQELGADRVVNAVGAIELYGGPLIIVDFGTATTFCAISEKAEYLGGAIAPGIQISTEALFQKAAKLPRVELVKPQKVIGKNTVESIQAGVIYGFVGNVDGIVRRMCHEFQHKPHVVATGGMAGLIASESETIEDVNYFLTLEGLRSIYEKNIPKRKVIE
jgi:type III pantothenate kinase